MKQTYTIVGFLVLLSLPLTQAFGQVSTLNTFSAGTPAVAADVNANFTAIETAVNGNTENIGANTTTIGTNTTAITANTESIKNLPTGGNPMSSVCQGNDANDIMVRVGPLCVDKYEASVWDTPTSGGTQANVCNENGDNCSGATAATETTIIYARSEKGVMPKRDITWFQAQQACANSGKRLLTNAEWQMAAAGTPDLGDAGIDATLSCNTKGGERGFGHSNTGSSEGVAEATECKSNWGVFDMVGNVHEWVADWVQGTTGIKSNKAAGAGANYGDDSISSIPASTQSDSKNMPAALYRGGSASNGIGAGVFSLSTSTAPSFSHPDVGFRCAR